MVEFKIGNQDCIGLYRPGDIVQCEVLIRDGDQGLVYMHPDPTTGACGSLFFAKMDGEYWVTAEPGEDFVNIEKPVRDLVPFVRNILDIID